MTENLKQVIISFGGIIRKQNESIEELIQAVHGENELNAERLQVLAQYSNHIGTYTQNKTREVKEYIAREDQRNLTNFKKTENNIKYADAVK